jgi:hypothetical protein
MGLQFRERHFYGVQAGAVWWHIEEPAAVCFECGFGLLVAVGGEVVEQDNSARLQLRGQHRTDVSGPDWFSPGFRPLAGRVLRSNVPRSNTDNTFWHSAQRGHAVPMPVRAGLLHAGAFALVRNEALFLNV